MYWENNIDITYEHSWHVWLPCQRIVKTHISHIIICISLFHSPGKMCSLSQIIIYRDHVHHTFWQPSSIGNLIFLRFIPSMIHEIQDGAEIRLHHYKVDQRVVWEGGIRYPQVFWSTWHNFLIKQFVFPTWRDGVQKCICTRSGFKG